MRLKTAIGSCLLLAAVLAGLATGAPTPEQAAAEASRLNEEGIALIGRREFAEAVARLESARSLKPLDLTLRRNLATAYAEWGAALVDAGRPGEAAEKLAFGVSLLPGDADLLTRLGLALYRASRRAEAKRAFERALYADPLRASARAWLGQILYEEGSLRGAIREWEKTLVVEPKRDDVAVRLARARREYEAERSHETLDSAHFVISFDGGEDRSIGGRVLRMLEDAYEEVAADLALRAAEPVKVVLYGEREFREVTGVEAWVGAIYDGCIRIPVRNLDAAEDRIRGAVSHEYAHVAVRSVTDRCPAWLDEGIAQRYEGRDLRSSRALAAAAAREKRLFPLSDLRAPFTRFSDAEQARLAYAEAHAFTEFLLAEHGADRAVRFLSRLGEGASEADAAEDAFHTALDAAFAEFVERLIR